MKTILYNPIFINPQAYYVFPRLTRYLQPDNESTAEPANYIGTIEVKVIAYGDTTLKRTYTNTDSIDLSEFKNTWIRISLFTKVGSCVLGEWKIGNMESDLPYIDPEVLASLKAVVIVGNKTNNDSDRAIVKNLVDPDNPFVISNAAYTEGSGYADKDSPYYGAFVTDGIDDLITSTKTVQEMLGGSNEITVVSMIHQVKDSSNNVSFTNYIRGSANGYFRNIVNNYDKTGIYGYTSSDLKGLSVVNNILGDKNDYTSNGDNRDSIINGNFSVQGYSYNDGNNTGDFSSVAWYWTIIANKVLTTDQINQVIAYFNLDRTLKSDIYCNIAKQGITNENHAEFGDKLIDFSGNGRDIQLNNIAWDGDSGIGKYNYPNWKVNVTQGNKYVRIVYYDSINGTYSADFKGITDLYKSYGLSIEIRVNRANTVDFHSIKEDGIYTVTPPDDTTSIDIRFGGENVYNASCDITITQIPSHAGALCLDGVNDFGKVIGMPIYKDYTFIIDREIISIGNTAGIVASKSEDSTDVNKQGAFLFEYLGAPNNISAWSFYKDNGKVANTDFTRGISYQSKYSYNGIKLLAGTALDSDKLWLGILRDKDSRFANVAIYSLMSFPYTMSKFLIERQLKKHKLGTLYPDMVEFRPIISSNIPYDKIEFFDEQWTKRIYPGDYVEIGATIKANLYLNNYDINTITSLTSSQFESVYIDRKRQYYDVVLSGIKKSPQKINITIDEYIRYEDIVQPYPVVFQIKDRNTNQIYSWGDKIKVGSSIQLTQGENPNLLNGLYSIRNYEYEGKAYSYNQLTNLNITVTKQSISLSCNKIWLLDNNEPKVILSPRLLRIPNSSYKILGHIPDISGHGNHGKINNSAYAGMSGANGYGTNLGNWSINSANTGKIITQREEYLEYKVLSADKNILFYNTKIENDTFVIYTSVNTNIVYSKESDIIANIPANTPTKVVCPKIGTILLKTNETPTVGNIITVKQDGIYEGAYCLDGVDDFVTIPTLSKGGKQMLMKVNWQSIAGTAILYDQRTNGGFAIFNRDFDTNENKVPAYRARNIGGSTYIDGILNEYIYASQLKDTTHNIVELYDPELNIGTLSPRIGCSYLNSNYSQMSLYDFMLFDEISTDDKIQELNKYVGIEAKVELPPYYWDTYGKTNLDADKATIQQRGVAIGDYDLTNYNHVYEGMSGYNGYPVVFGANKTWETLSSVYSYISDVTSTTIHVTMVKNAGTGLLFSYVKKDEALTNIKEIPAFRVTIKGLEGNSKFGYRYLATEDATGETLVYLGNGTHELAKSFAPTEALLDLTRNAWVGIFITPMVEGEVVFDCDITIEVLPEYENGLAYDGVEDFSDNKNVPLIDDFTVIAKRTWLEENTSDKPFIIKGDTLYPDGNKNAFLFEYGKLSTYSFGQNNKYDESVVPSLISWATPTSYNGTTSLVRGSAIDAVGIDIAHATKIVLYKLILYPKTIPLLQINFLKNLMERDEIIDLNNPIFIQE